MTWVLDTNEFPVTDRAEVEREAIATTIVPVEIAWPNRTTRVAAQGVISDLGQLTPDLIRQACAVSLSPRHPVTALTANNLCRLAANPALFTALTAEAVGHPSIELIRAVTPCARCRTSWPHRTSVTSPRTSTARSMVMPPLPSPTGSTR
jgi:hypothetical protein